MIQLRQRWTEQLLQLILGHTRAVHRHQKERLVRDEPDRNRARIDDGWESLLEDLYNVPKRILTDPDAAECQICSRRPQVRMGFDGERRDNAIGSAATAGQSPVQVSILSWRRHQELSRTGHDFPFQGLICSEAKLGGQGAVSAALRVTACYADGRAVTAYHDEALIVGSLVRFYGLNSRSHFQCSPCIMGRPVVDDFRRLHVMGPDPHRTCPRCLAIVVVSGIADGQTDVVFFHECDRLLKVIGVGGVHGVRYVIPKSARSVPREKRIAAVVGEEGRHDRRRGIEVCLREEPGGLEVGATLRVE